MNKKLLGSILVGLFYTAPFGIALWTESTKILGTAILWIVFLIVVAIAEDR